MLSVIVDMISRSMKVCRSLPDNKYIKANFSISIESKKCQSSRKNRWMAKKDKEMFKGVK